MSVHPVESRPPILAAAADIGAALTRAVGANPVFMTTAEMDEALRELSALEARVVELRLRVMAGASEVAKSTAAHDVAEWLSVHTLMRPEDARADLRLATALDRRYAALAAAMREGGVSVDQARVIARALDELPREDLPTDVLVAAETALVEHATRFGPRQLARLGRRILEVVAPGVVEETEARRLAALEADAHRRTRLSLRRVGDGTTPPHRAPPRRGRHPAGDLPGGLHQPSQDTGAAHRRPRRMGDSGLPPPPRAGLLPAPGDARPDPAPPSWRRCHHRGGHHPLPGNAHRPGHRRPGRLPPTR